MTKQEFIQLFTVNPDMYALQKDTGDYRSIKEPLTWELFDKHSAGEITLGIYCLSKDSKAKFVCIDIDQDDKDEVRKYLAACWYLGLSDPLLEFSGRKGYHIIIPFNAPIPGWKARALAQMITANRSYPVEIYPVQDYLSDGMLGSLIKVPYGVHKVTNKRSMFLNRDFMQQKFADVQVTYTSEETVDSIIKDFAPVKPTMEHTVSRYPCNDAMFKNIDKNVTPHISINMICFRLAARLYKAGIPRIMAESILSEWLDGNTPLIPLSERDKRTALEKHLNSGYSGKYGIGCTDPMVVDNYCVKKACGIYNKINDPEEVIDFNAEDLIPDRGIVKDYVEYAGLRNSAPVQYHVLMALQLINCMVKDKVWHTGASGEKIYTNIYSLFVGDSGVGKTTAINTGLKVLRSIDPTLIHPSDYASRQGFLESLSEEPQGICIFNEFEDLLAKRSQNAHEGIIVAITNLYDYSEDQYEVKARTQRGSEDVKQAPIVIYKPKLSLASATTVEGLTNYLKPQDLRTGFFVRFSVVYAHRVQEWGFKTEDADIKHRFSSLVSHLKHFYRDIDEKEADFSEVEAEIDKYCRGMLAELKNDPYANLFAAFYTRLNIYLLKYAMLYQLSFDGTVNISEYALAMAMKMVDFLKQNIRYMILEKVNFGRFQQNIAMLKEMIEKEGDMGVTRAKLLRRSKLDQREFDNIIKTLIQREEIHMKNIGKSEAFCKA